mmetsp:Transcript_80257/g.214462  ORF Transcript_80257/g.214462 Transcript_80257/m.214462 type:complete len:228 (-) Transcript_80257:626-1309(-)
MVDCSRMALVRTRLSPLARVPLAAVSVCLVRLAFIRPPPSSASASASVGASRPSSPRQSWGYSGWAHSIPCITPSRITAREYSSHTSIQALKQTYHTIVRRGYRQRMTSTMPRRSTAAFRVLARCLARSFWVVAMSTENSVVWVMDSGCCRGSSGKNWKYARDRNRMRTIKLPPFLPFLGVNLKFHCWVLFNHSLWNATVLAPNKSALLISSSSKTRNPRSQSGASW